MNSSAESAPGSVPKPDKIMGMMWGFAAPILIEAAIQNRIFDLLDGGQRTHLELASASGASPRGVKALADGLVGIGLLLRSAGGGYGLAPESAAFLVSTKPQFQGRLFAHMVSDLIPHWLDLPKVVRTGLPAISVETESAGSAFFEHFVESLFYLNYGAAMALAKELALGKIDEPVKVLDIAAGSGVWGIALAQTSPRVQLTAVDWEKVLPVTRRIAAQYRVESQLETKAGDILQVDYGSGYRVATLGHILHSEGEARSRALLQKVFDALAPGGTIAVAEFLVNQDRSGPPQGLIFGVNMLLHTKDGSTYSFEEIRGWLESVGFSQARTLEAPGPSPLILATKP